MRANDLVFAFPALLIAIMITAVFGPGAINAIIAIGIFNIPVFARLARAGGAGAVDARLHPRRARRRQGPDADLGRAHPAQHRQHAGGAGDDPVLARHSRRGRALLCRARRAAADAELGPDAGRQPDAGWRSRPWLAIFPGCAIVFTVLGLNLLGDGLRDMFDPRLRRAPMSLLEIAGLRVSIDAVPILNGVDLSLARGKILGMIGEFGLGQVDDGALGHASAARARPRRRPHHLRRTRSARRQRGRDEPAARRRHRNGVPGADDGARSAQDHRRAGRRRDRLAHPA